MKDRKDMKESGFENEHESDNAQRNGVKIDIESAKKLLSSGLDSEFVFYEEG